MISKFRYCGMKKLEHPIKLSKFGIMSSRKTLFAIAGTLIVLVASCRKDRNPYWDVDVAVPLAHTQIFLQDAFQDNELVTNPDSSLTFIYKGTLLDLRLDSAFAMPDTTIIDKFSLPFNNVTLYPGQKFFADSTAEKHEFDDALIRLLKLRTGTIHINISSTLAEKTVFAYRLPLVTKNGQSISISDTIPAGSLSNPVLISRSFDLSGYDIDMTGPDGNDFNRILTIYEVIIDPNGNPVVVTNDDEFVIEYTYSNFVFEYARGYFGNRTIEENSNSNLDLFNNVLAGYLALDKATAVVTIENQFGIDIAAFLKKIEAINDANNQNVLLTGPLIGQTLHLNRAFDNGNGYPPLSTRVLTDTFDIGNSNITEFISNLPDAINYDISAQLNPKGNVSGSNDFIYYNTGLVLNIDLSIPWRLSATNLTIIDTTEFSMGIENLSQVKKIKDGTIFVYAKNHYPFSALMQFYFYDDNQVLLDSLFTTPEVVASGIPGPDGKVNEPALSILRAPVSGSKIERLNRATSVVMLFTVNTANQPDKVAVYENYMLDITMTATFNYNLEF